jgi:hypothetical protein
LRAVYRTLSRRGAITTGMLIGMATVSSIALNENVTALIVIWLLIQEFQVETSPENAAEIIAVGLQG